VTNNAKKAYEFRKKRLNIESQFEVKSHSYGRTLLILGDLAIRAGYFDKAEKYLTQAYQFFLQNISNSEYHQFKTLSILVYFHSLLNQNTQAKKYFDILQQAINKSGDTQGYTESVSYLKAKTLIKFMNINSEQAESEYNKVNNSLKDLSDHMRHHELFTQYLKIKVKIAQKDKQSASKSWQNFKKMLDKFPNDYFTLKKASELLGIEIQSLN
jgi:tetratricopeptide (TPR) repeat protein